MFPKTRFILNDGIDAHAFEPVLYELHDDERAGEYFGVFTVFHKLQKSNLTIRYKKSAEVFSFLP